MNYIEQKLLQEGLEKHKKGFYIEAEKIYRKAIQINPKLSVAYNNLGVLLKANSRLDEAILSFKKAIEIKTDYFECYNNLGISYKEIGKLEEAKNFFLKAIKYNSKYISAYHNLGIIFHLQKKLDEAEKYYDHVLELDRNFKPALLNRGQVLFDNNNFESSLKDFDTCDTRDSRARSLASLYSLGKIEEIYKRIEKFSKIDDENLHIAAFSAFINAKQKKNTANKFCKNPLEFIYSTNILRDKKNAIFSIDELISELRKIKSVWEPSNKTTQNGFQSTINLFENPSKKLSKLKDIIFDQIDNYYFNFKNKSCTFIERWPTKKNLEGWYVILKQQGYQSSHIHPNGWLSGVIYLKVVPGLDKNEGSIEFSLNSRNYFDINSPKTIFNPQVGDLILFPSTLHHRTIPFTTNTDRVIISFDLIPEK